MVSRPRKVVVFVILALLPALIFYWRGYIELYIRYEPADVRVNGVPAGYVHRGKVSALVTRNDVPGRHTYRIWTTATDILIFDCHNWVAPERRYFLQGRISAPCILATSGAGSFAPTAPAANAVDDHGILRFTTKDGKVISLKRPW